MNNLYSENILDHFRFPRNFGHLKNPDAKSTESNPLCGDRLGVEVKYKKNSRIIEQIRFSGEGCAISIASASMLTVLVTGMGNEEVFKLNQNDIEKLLGIKPSYSRLKCALLSLETLHKALGKS
jgi:nitrogen fixation NifU-like protein